MIRIKLYHIILQKKIVTNEYNFPIFYLNYIYSF